MKQTVRIVHVRYLDKDRNRYIGGIESYIRGLCEVSIDNGFNVVVYQGNKKTEARLVWDGMCFKQQ